MPEIRLDSEKLLRCIKRIESELDVIRREAALGTAAAPSVQGIDLTKIDWKGKLGADASLGDEWSWTFAYEQSGGYKDESETLVKAIEAAGKVVVDGYVMTLSGRDKRLLNRKKLKREGG